uniref:Testicular haploid expressed gene protein n=1 Tax=Macrostomum lignano TaxID=282301 RepID=A0A1I8H8Y4_9PLAT
VSRVDCISAMNTDEQHPAFDVSYVRSKIWAPVCVDIVRHERTVDLDIRRHPLYARRPDLLRRTGPKHLPGAGSTWVSEWLQQRFEKPKMSEPKLANRPKSELPPCTPGRVIKQSQQSGRGKQKSQQQQHYPEEDLNHDNCSLDDSCCEDCCFCCPGRRRGGQAGRQLVQPLAADNRSATSVALPLPQLSLLGDSNKQLSL